MLIGSQYPVSIQIEAWDRLGFMRDLTAVVAEEKVNLASVNLINHDDQTISILVTLEIEGLAQLSRLLRKIDAVRGVINITRVGDNVSAKKN